MSLSSGLKDIRRASHVAGVLFKHGMGYFIHKHRLKLHLPFRKRVAVHRYRKPMMPEARLRKSFEELGGTYVKLGQLLSLRPDLVPPQYCREFSKLQDEVPPFSFEKAKKIVEKELGKPLNKIFKSFDSKPIGSASIGQVHLAKLRNGRNVVVKVRRPGIKEVFDADIDLMYYFAKKLEKDKGFDKYSPLRIVEEFERYTKNELNYLIEANNIEKFYENMKNVAYVKIPKLYRNYTTSKVLVMEYIKGKKLSDIMREKKKFDKKAVINSLAHAGLKQVFEHGVFHADMHPGNIILANGGKIGLIDFGIVGSLKPFYRKEGIKLYVALVNKDIERIVKGVLRLGKPSNKTDTEKLKEEIDDIVSSWHGTELRQVRVTSMLVKILDRCVSHHIKIPVDVVLLGKCLVTVEGTCLMLNPRYNFVRESEQYLKKYIKRRIISEESFKIFLDKSREMAETLEMIPSEAMSVLQKLKHGVIKIDIEDTDLKRLALDIDKSSNRLSYAVVIAALIVSAALMMHANVGPYYKGFSFPAMVLYIIAAFMILTLFVSIVKEGSIWR